MAVLERRPKKGCNVVNIALSLGRSTDVQRLGFKNQAQISVM